MASPCSGDETVIADIRRAAATAGNRIDITVNNAGWSHSNKPMNDVSEGEFGRLFEVNVKSIYMTSQIIVPPMSAAGGASTLTLARRPDCGRALASPGIMRRRVRLSCSPSRWRSNSRPIAYA
jgi:NAD(P)-dependent dehydrogenase (short-subunit alcohol dehydrogenase family)